MTPLTTKAAEIRAGLVAKLRRAVTTGEDGCGTLPAKEAVKVRPVDWHRITRLAREAAALIEQQAAELAEARAEVEKHESLIASLRQACAAHAEAGKALHGAYEAAESERDELLRENERLGVEALTFPPGWPEKTRELYDRCKFWPEKTPDGIMALIELRNHVFAAISAPSVLEVSPAGLADANSKSPVPSSQSERIAEAVAAEREECAKLLDDARPASHDMTSTFICEALERVAASIRARSALAPLGEE